MGAIRRTINLIIALLLVAMGAHPDLRPTYLRRQMSAGVRFVLRPRSWVATRHEGCHCDSQLPGFVLSGVDWDLTQPQHKNAVR